MTAAAPSNPAVLTRAHALHSEGRLVEAEALYREVLKAEPQQVDALQLLALIESQMQRHVEALALFDAALRLRPGLVSAWVNRGVALQALKRFEEAAASYERALLHKPDHVTALFNRAVVLQEMKQHAAALAAFDAALSVSPDHTEAHYSRSVVLQGLGRHAEAREGYGRVRRLRPDHEQAPWNEGLCALLLGDYAAGWPGYEWRFRQQQHLAPTRDWGVPRWRGGPEIAGRTILLHHEQGLGDTIQFCRYAQAVAARGGNVVLEVQPPLKTLLAELEGIQSIVAHGEALPPINLHCPLLSLPLAFGTDAASIPGPPSLHARAPQIEAWHQRLGGDTRLRVGVAWSGGTAYGRDSERSIPLAEFRRLLFDGVGFYALQKELREADRPVLQAHPEIRYFGDELRDFTDTAALIEAMDVVVTVDTSVAHLAGSMGKPVWILLPANPDWRWLLDREDSPWYPSARLFRQPVAGDWVPVLDRVRDALTDLAARRTH